MKSIICKEDIRDSKRVLFTQGEKYAIEDTVCFGGVAHAVTTDNAGCRNYLSTAYMGRHFDVETIDNAKTM